MNAPIIIAIGVLLAGMSLVAAGAALIAWKLYVRVPVGRALVVHRGGAEPRVSLGGGALVLPLVNTAQLVDITDRNVTVERAGTDALVCADGARVDVRAVFCVGVEATQDDIVKVARRALDADAIERHFAPRFIDALGAIVGQLSGADVVRDRTAVKAQVLGVLGRDLDGYVLRDLAFERLAVPNLPPDRNGT